MLGSRDNALLNFQLGGMSKEPADPGLRRPEDSLARFFPKDAKTVRIPFDW